MSTTDGVPPDKVAGIVTIVCVLSIALGGSIMELFSPPSLMELHLEAIQYGYGRIVNGKFEWILPEQRSTSVEERVNE